MSFHSDGYTVALGTMYGNVLIYDLRVASSTKAVLTGHAGSAINSVDFARVRGREASAAAAAPAVSPEQQVQNLKREPTN
jgi:hypothetical protein